MLEANYLNQSKGEREMEQERNLYVGFDLGSSYSQISCYDERTERFETISSSPALDNGLIPTVLGVTKERREWVYGNAAKKLNEDEGIIIDRIYEKLLNNEKFHVYGVLFTGADILEKFFRKTLMLLKQHYPSQSIAKLVITVKSRNNCLTKAIYEALSSLGIKKDRALVQYYEESYICYALGQEKELWINDIGLFDLDEEGLSYYQLQLNRRTKPLIVSIKKRELYDTLNLAMLGRDTNEKNAYLFLNTAKTVLHKQGVSTIYITGIGFLEEWADHVLKELCIGRRVFKGQNLYTKGACFKAMELEGKKEFTKYAFIGDDMIRADVILPVYHNAREEQLLLAKVGTSWNEINNEVYFILDEEDEVQIIVDDPMKKEIKTYLLQLDGLPHRPNKGSRIKLNISFIDKGTAVITMKDDGFGVFYETSNRVWEKTIVI